jgi:type VI secretion system protein ImpK
MPGMHEDFDATSWETAVKGSRSLVDLCSEAFSLIFHIHAGNDPGHPEDLRKNINLLFRDLEKQAKRCGYSEEDIKAARYALCALIDETILNSRWSFRVQWGDRPLQLEHFNDNMAGERFFDLLDRVRQKGRRKADLLEVFCMCLILGFQGKYKLRGLDELAQLINTLVEEEKNYRGSPSNLASHWKIPEESVERPANIIPRWAWMTGLAAILIVILSFLVFKLWLGSMVEDAARLMIL